MSDPDLDVLASALESAARRVGPPPEGGVSAATARGRRRRLVRRAGFAGAAAGLILAAIVPLLLLSPLAGDHGPVPPAISPTQPEPSVPETPDTTPPPSTGKWPATIAPEEGRMAAFAPATHREDGSVVIPVTFPDGTTAELVYPPALDLAGEPFRPYSSGHLSGVARDFAIEYGAVEDVLARWGGATLVAEYRDGLGGTVGFWDLQSERDADFLAFQFGSWTVLVYDYTLEAAAGVPMSDDVREQWARSLQGEEAKDGLLVLSALDPLNLAGAGEHAGPELMIGYGNPRLILLFPGRCEELRAGVGGLEEDDLVESHGIVMSRSPGFASWCDPGGLMRVHVYQAPGDDYIDRVARGLVIRDVRLAS